LIFEPVRDKDFLAVRIKHFNKHNSPFFSAFDLAAGSEGKRFCLPAQTIRGDVQNPSQDFKLCVTDRAFVGFDPVKPGFGNAAFSRQRVECKAFGNAVDCQPTYYFPGKRQRNSPFVCWLRYCFIPASFGLPGESTTFHPGFLHQLNRTLSQRKREGNNISNFLIASKIAVVKGVLDFDIFQLRLPFFFFFLGCVPSFSVYKPFDFVRQ